MAPLPSFSRVNEIVLVQSPAGDGPSGANGQLPSRLSKALTGAAPQTILFLSWGDASARYIEKYTNLYTEIYPNARIIIVKTGMAEFFWRPESTQLKLAEPVVKMLSEEADDTLLIHVMSNAGSKQWCTINKSYFESTGRTLSNAVTILDSAPGRSQFKQTWAALTRSLPKAYVPRLALGTILGFVLCVMQASKFIFPAIDVWETSRVKMNEPEGTVKGARRCYIYSEEDDVIGWEDVENHARDAQQKGWEVELVKFQGSTHVGHFKQNPEKYRETIEKTWAGRSKL